MTTLSLTMREAIKRAHAGNDALYRWPGGYWTDRPWDGTSSAPKWWVASNTVQALVDRRLVSTVDWSLPRIAGRRLAFISLTDLAREYV